MGQDEIAPGAPTGVIHCVPLPAWVQHEPYADSASGDDEAYVGNGLCRLLYDTQVDLSGTEYAWHVRTVRRVLTRAGAEQVAHVTVEYDPLYERAEVHFVRVVRGEERIEHAKPDRFQILRRETNLNRLVLDGRLTASLLIADVRIGDVVEIALTLRGANPAVGGKHTAWVAFDDFNPAAETRYRLLRAERRAVSVKRFNEPPALATSKANGIEDMRWRMVRPTRREAEEYVPPWRLEAPTLHFSEFSNWAEVVDLFAPLYESAALPKTPVRRLQGCRPALCRRRPPARPRRLRGADLHDAFQGAGRLPAGLQRLQSLHRAAADRRQILLARSDRPVPVGPARHHLPAALRLGAAAGARHHRLGIDGWRRTHPSSELGRRDPVRPQEGLAGDASSAGRILFLGRRCHAPPDCERGDDRPREDAAAGDPGGLAEGGRDRGGFGRRRLAGELPDAGAALRDSRLLEGG
ncbi:MAG: DUF3857 domain-containing protein [Reyranella sp.]|nr:DUF3857 domain-containing protein [Reyranella sp.]